MTKWKKIRRLSMDLTKDRGGHVKVMPPVQFVIHNGSYKSGDPTVVLEWPTQDGQ